MATKKRKKSPAHRPARRKASAPKHKRRRRHGLSSAAGLTMFKNGLKHTFSGAAGGYSAAWANKLIPANFGKLGRLLTIAGLGLAGVYMGVPIYSAGLVGGMTALTFPNGALNEDGEESFADDDALSDMPLFLDEDGNPMVLEEGEDGTSGYRYLSDNEIETLERQGAFTDYEVVS